ncbi:MAG TPA: cytochrome C biogenesis protein, partial [Ferruginibacter sp.]|nr:cytochrome C biogenesis protein [Ferruginibacter sp.]
MIKHLRLLFLALFSLPGLISYSQADTTGIIFKWTASSKKTGDKKYELTFSAPAVAGISLYAPGQDLDGVISAEIVFSDSSIRAGKIEAGTNIQKVPSVLFKKGTVQLVNGAAEWKTVVDFKDIVPAKLLGSLTYFYNKGDEFLSDIPFEFSVALEGGIASGGRIKVSSIDIKNPGADCGDEGTQNKSLAGIFLLGFLGGLIALITPCVFPMIPVTVTFFTKKSPDKKKGIANAVFYGLFIFLIYVAITIPFHIASKTIS